jgi:hypothetical protein
MFLTQLHYLSGGTLPTVMPTPKNTVQFSTKKSRVQSLMPYGLGTTTSS